MKSGHSYKQVLPVLLFTTALLAFLPAPAQKKQLYKLPDSSVPLMLTGGLTEFRFSSASFAVIPEKQITPIVFIKPSGNPDH